jgi:thioredoxin-related protein
VKTKRFLPFFVLLLTLGVLGPAWAEPAWETNFKKAQELAKTGNKLVLLDFTGSDWCGWCMKLKQEVFSQPEFKNYATKNLVLVEVDFPRAKEQAVSVRMQNEELASQYGIQGFPTIIVLSGHGKKVGELHYMEGGPTAFIAELEKLRKS